MYRGWKPLLRLNIERINIKWDSSESDPFSSARDEHVQFRATVRCPKIDLLIIDRQMSDKLFKNKAFPGGANLRMPLKVNIEKPKLTIDFSWNLTVLRRGSRMDGMVFMTECFGLSLPTR